MLTSQNCSENEQKPCSFVSLFMKKEADKEHFLRKDRTLKKISPEE